MTDTTQEDVRLAIKYNQDARVILASALDSIEAGESVDFDDIHEWWKSLVGSAATITLALTAYQSLGSPEYLAALVEEHEAGSVCGTCGYARSEVERSNATYVCNDSWHAAHDNAERLRDVGDGA